MLVFYSVYIHLYYIYILCIYIFIHVDLFTFSRLKHIGQIYCFLNARLPPGCVQMYHRKVKESIQDSIVNDFMSDTSSLRVIVCSSSFSMGRLISFSFYALYAVYEVNK